MTILPETLVKLESSRREYEWRASVNLFGCPDRWRPYVTFKNATIVVVSLYILTNALWFALGRPHGTQQDVPWAPALMRTPMFILCDIAVVTVLLVVVIG